MIQRWKVPYTVADTPGAKGGWLIVVARSREDALNAAIEKHRRSAARPDGTGAGRRLTLTPTQRGRIRYEEPVALDAAGEVRQDGAA